MQLHLHANQSHFHKNGLEVQGNSEMAGSTTYCLVFNLFYFFQTEHHLKLSLRPNLLR